MSLGIEQSEVVAAGRRRLFLWAVLLLVGSTWGAALALTKLATTYGAHPLGIALWQTVGSGSILLVLSLLTRRPPKLAPPVLRFNFVCGLIGLAFPATGLAWAAVHLPAGVVAIAFAAMPMITYGLSALFRVEPLQTQRLLGVLLGLAAVGLIVLPESALPAPDLAPWVLLAMATSLSMSTENLYIAVRRPPDSHAVPLSFGRQFAAAIILAPLAFALDAVVPAFTTWGPLQYTLTAMAVCTATAYTVFLYVVQKAGPVFASQSAYIITLAAVFWGMVLFGERHSLFIWAALALMLVGLALVKPRRN